MRGFWLLFFSLAWAMPARAEVVITSLGDMPFFDVSPTWKEYSLDLNLDGSDDLVFRVASGSYFQVTPNAGVEVAGWMYPPPDIGSLAFAFSDGYLLSAELPETMSWNSGVSFLQSSAQFGDTTLFKGYFGGATEYLGVRISGDDGWHYAWVRIDAPFIGINGGYFKDFAFETEAGLAIAMASIPEPATAALLLGALALGYMAACQRVKRQG